MTKSTHIVFNNSLQSSFSFAYPKLTESQIKEHLAGLFEQVLLFDRIVINTGRLNFSLYFLIRELGINRVEEMIEWGLIKFLLWTPIIVTGSGMQREDGSIDESTIRGIPPISAGALTNEDSDPEANIDKALSFFPLNRERKRIFKRLARDNYIVPKGMDFSKNSAEIVLDAYKTNCLADLGLPFDTPPEQMELEKRKILLDLGYNVLETAILSKYHLKSFSNYSHYKICEGNLKNIGNALNVTQNVSKILQIENVPNLKELFISEKMDIQSAFKLRHLGSAKYFRKWINELDHDNDAISITSEYLNELKGKKSFFQSTGGKFLRFLGVFGVGTALESAIIGTGGMVAGFGLGMLDTFWFDSILKGRNPSMFIDQIKAELQK